MRIEALREAGVACSVIPGITAGLGAAAESEVPLTFRGEALRITFLTAHKARDAEAVDWSALTDEKMTVVVYMGMTAAPAIRAGLLAAGRSPQTPVGVFARATRPDAQAVTGALVALDDFNVALYDGSGEYHSFKRTPSLKVVKNDPLQAHHELLDKYTNKNMHDIVAYLETLK